jgi:hypothetical protein
MVESWKSHLKTDKYSDHIALNEFYDEIVDLVDALIEEYQGIYGKVKDLKNVMSTDKQSALDYLESLREMTREGKSLFKEDELKSDIDAILSLLDSTIYKLKELKESDQHRSMKSLSNYLTERLNESHLESINEAEEAEVEKEESKELSEMPEDEKYGVLQTGGTIGEQNKDTYYHAGSVFGTLVLQDVSKDEATEFAKKRRKRLSPGERKYYGINYRVVPMKSLKKVAV